MEVLEAKMLTQHRRSGAAGPLLQALVGHVSDTSRSRPNEDFFGSITPEVEAVDSKGIVLAIADGLSGGAGRAAAESVVYSVLTDYYATPAGVAPRSALASVIAASNGWLYAQNGRVGEDKGMVTTLSVLALCGRHYHVAHVGDTRVYRWRRDKLQKLTTDHIWRGGSGHHRVLRRALGLDAQVLIDFQDGELESGDVFLLLTDGAWETVSEAEMTSYLGAESDPQRLADMLIEQAMLRGSHFDTNDATAAIVRIEAARD